jgi:hypothetical protein
MATLDWELTRSGEVTLVELTVNSEFDQHVRIESELTPVWPPRRQSVPHTGWNGDTFEGNVSQDETLVCGYASPAEPVEPPAAIAATESPDEETSVCPRDIVQTLGEPSPPRDTLEGSTAQTERVEGSTAPTERVEGSTAPTEGVGESSLSNEELAVTQVGKDETEVTTGHGQSSVADTLTPETEAEPTAWFDAVEKRVATTEQLAQTADAEDVRDVVADVGGIEDVRALQAQLDADRRQLSELQQRTETLSERLASVELPLATLERIV